MGAGWFPLLRTHVSPMMARAPFRPFPPLPAPSHPCGASRLHARPTFSAKGRAAWHPRDAPPPWESERERRAGRTSLALRPGPELRVPRPSQGPSPGGG